MAADPKSVSVEALKIAFKEGATPNEEDYHALIDLAAVGGKALGGNDNIPPKLSPGMGLQMEKGQLAVKVKKDAGVTLDGYGVSVKGDENTVTVTAAGVGIKVKANGGLEANAEGLEIKLAEKGGLKADNDGLAVQVAPDKGLEIDAKTGLKVKLKAGKDNYIESTDAGLAITPQGIDAIKTALKSASLDALDSAVKGTSQGYKLDSNLVAGDVEAKIAEQLNVAYAEGWKLTQARAALLNVLTEFRTARLGKFIATSSIGPSSASNSPDLYAQDGTVYKPEQIVTYKVSSGGAAETVTWDEKVDGIYALVGKLDATGKPSEKVDKYTPHALMVIVANGSRAVIGHWDFLKNTEWEGSNRTGAWSTSPVTNGCDITSLRKRLDDQREQMVKTAQEEGRDAAFKPVTVKFQEKDTYYKIEKSEGDKLAIVLPPVSIEEIRFHSYNTTNGTTWFVLGALSIEAFGEKATPSNYQQNSFENLYFYNDEKRKNSKQGDMITTTKITVQLDKDGKLYIAITERLEDESDNPAAQRASHLKANWRSHVIHEQPIWLELSIRKLWLKLLLVE
ncbi:hypothetical protein SME46J_48360 (plasmid) [Serratia marcescens]|nr:hypothetical protein SME46J_48360 [Serratia marcescens]